MKKVLITGVCLLLLLQCFAMPVKALETGQPYHRDLSSWIKDDASRDYVEMMLDYHVRSNKLVRDALSGGFAAVFIFDGCSDHMEDPELSDLTYYRVSGVCVVLRQDAAGNIKMVYINDNCSTIPDRPLEYGAWSLPDVGDVGPATICDGTYQLYSVRHKGKYEALHVRTDYFDDRVDAVYMIPDGYVTSRANEINIHTRTSNHVSGRGMWSAGCPLVGGGDTWEFWKLIQTVYHGTYETFELDNFAGTLTIDRMPLRTELYTLYENPDAVDMFLTNSRHIQPEVYLEQCAKTETFVEAEIRKIAAETQLMTLPCSNDTDARSRQLGLLYENQRLNVNGSVRNTEGNLWYEVICDGQRGYVFSGAVTERTFFDKVIDYIMP